MKQKYKCYCFFTRMLHNIKTYLLHNMSFTLSGQRLCDTLFDSVKKITFARRGKKSVQGFGGKTRRKETTWKTKK
jgi:hypothetical protein